MQKKVPVKRAKDGQVEKLRKQLERYKEENRKLKQQIKKIEQGLDVSREFLKDTTESIKMDRLIDAAKQGKGLKEIKQDEIKDACPKCLSLEYKLTLNILSF